MMYDANHPYFTKYNNEHCTCACACGGNCNCKNNEEIADVVYVEPAIHPVWNNDIAKINKLKPSWFDSFNGLKVLEPKFNYFGGYLVSDGYLLNNDSSIETLSEQPNPSKGVITAVPVTVTNATDDEFEIEKTTETAIVNTENGGFRYVHFNEDGTMKDISPVWETCIVGNADRPEALLVPLYNVKAIADAAVITDHLVKELSGDCKVIEDNLNNK